VHLICEKLFWLAYREEEDVEELTPAHYMEAVQNALVNVEARLRKAYDKAVKKDLDQYQEILWAVADHYELERNAQSIYTNSYQRIMSDLERTPVTQKTKGRGTRGSDDRLAASACPPELVCHLQSQQV
jgi:uncharacterized protein